MSEWEVIIVENCNVSASRRRKAYVEGSRPPPVFNTDQPRPDAHLLHLIFNDLLDRHEFVRLKPMPYHEHLDVAVCLTV